MDWTRWANFTAAEMQCRCGCEGDGVTEGLLDACQGLRDAVGPCVVSSAYRCPAHPVEAVKPSPGAHSAGLAVDIICATAARRYEIVRHAMQAGRFVGCGISEDFIHLDIGHPRPEVGRPALWTY
jgi:zinc D-Ala-D-Ala carboxypeptidase